MPPKKRIEQEIVETAGIAHHVDHRAPGFERMHPLDGSGIEIEVPEKTARKPFEEKLKRGVIAEPGSAKSAEDSSGARGEFPRRNRAGPEPEVDESSADTR